ncbi:LacI family DNA-binding transcriptional regulator [Arthrobacter pigmenti]
MKADDQPRMSDVAARAGVSMSTVSRAMRGAPGVAVEVRERVLLAAGELSYVVSRDASSLVTRKTGRVAVLIPFLDTWFFSVVVASINRSLHAAGLDTLIYQFGHAKDLEKYICSLPLRRNVDAVIVVSLNLGDKVIAELKTTAIPSVFCSAKISGQHWVAVDNETAAFSATSYLLNLGHRDIAFIQTQEPAGFSWKPLHRVDGYLSAMEDTKTEPRIVIAPAGPSGGADAMSSLLGSASVPTAVFAETDDIALGVMQVLRRSRVQVPEAISVIGFDDSDAARTLDLTTVAQPVSELGEASAHMVIELFDSEETSLRQIELPTKIVIRETTGTPRNYLNLNIEQPS